MRTENQRACERCGAGVCACAANETSVLFSLASLATLAASPPSARSPSSDGSGLIDIRMLAGNASAAATPPPRAVALPLAPVSRHALPVVIAPRAARRSHRPLLGALVALAASLAMVSGGMALAMARRGSVRATAIPPGAVPAAPIEIVSPVAVPSMEASPIEIADVDPIETSPSERAPERRPVRDRAPRREREAEHVVAAEVRPARTEGRPSIDELIRRSVEPTAETEPATPSSTASVPEAPSRSAVRAAMTAIEPALRRCAGGAHGRLRLRLVVTGATGHARSVATDGDFSGAAAACMSAAAREATLPAFSRTSFTIDYPYSL